MIYKLDDTHFEVNFLDMYKTYIKSFLMTKITGYLMGDVNELKEHWFDVLFLTPSNMASDFYKTDFFVTTMVIDGVQSNTKQDIEGTAWTDVTDVETQVYFNNFEE